MINQTNLDSVLEFINELNTTNSQNDKVEVLKKYKRNETVKKVCLYTYSQFIKFNTTSTNIKKNSSIIAPINNYSDIFGLLDDLKDRVITGHAAIGAVNSFIKENPKYEELIYNIIDNNLKTRIDSKLINKSWGEYIPVFDVALANSYEDYKEKVNFNRQKWYASRKLDGLRCLTIIDDKGNIEIKSRKGLEFETLVAMKDLFKSFNLKSVVFDGEISLKTSDGSDDFTGILKVYKKKDYIIPNYFYHIFDMIKYEDFMSRTSIETFSERNNKLKQYKTQFESTGHIEICNQILISSKEELDALFEQALSNGWEGLILRLDAEYKGKRSNDLLKVKAFKDDEYIVKSIETGPFRVIENGVEVEIQTMTNIFIEHKGYPVSVGSGFSLDERKKYFDNPKLIVGKTITVKYFGESANQNGGLSLRFPTVKSVYDEERDC